MPSNDGMYEVNIHMNYLKIYNQLIEHRQTNVLVKDPAVIGKVETHHIIPKCVGGDDSLTNLVNLYPREHYIAHLLLMKIYPNNIGLSFAIMSMAGKNPNVSNKRLFKFNSRLYEKLKLNHGQRMKKHFEMTSCPIKGKKLMFNTMTNKLEYWTISGNIPDYVVQAKTIWICNDELKKETEIYETQEIPADWRIGRLVNKKVSHSGLMMISNPNTLEVRYVDKNQTIPIGWKRGKSRKLNSIKKDLVFRRMTEIYGKQVREYFNQFMHDKLSLTSLTNRFPELKLYTSANYIFQLFARYVPEFKGIRECKRQFNVKSIEGYWNNTCKNSSKNHGTAHVIKRAILKRAGYTELTYENLIQNNPVS